jgi:hypothetical protein
LDKKKAKNVAKLHKDGKPFTAEYKIYEETLLKKLV